jgi:tetratricopeptide (TPR) repeat protein
VGLVSIIVLTGGVIGLALWWEDRPLRAIEQALDRKEFAQALDMANEHLKEFPNHPQAIDKKARALVGLQRWAEAGRLFEFIGADSFVSQRAWSIVLLHEERWTEALPLLTRLNELAPDDGDILHELCACEGHLGYFEESIQAAERLVKLPGNERRGALLLGMLHYKRGNNRLAIQAWQPILEHASDLSDLQTSAAEFLLAYGRALVADGRPAEALPQLKRAVTLEPSAETRNALAEACDGLGDRPAAVALWQQVVATSTANRTAREGLAQAALENKSPAEAQRWLEPLLSEDDLASSTAFLAQRAATLAGDQQAAAEWRARENALRAHEKRISTLEQSLRDSPRSFWSRCVRAHHFASEGNLQQALVLAEDLLKQRPDEPFVEKLVESIRKGTPLPSLELIPLQQY